MSFQHTELIELNVQCNNVLSQILCHTAIMHMININKISADTYASSVSTVGPSGKCVQFAALIIFTE